MECGERIQERLVLLRRHWFARRSCRQREQGRKVQERLDTIIRALMRGCLRPFVFRANTVLAGDKVRVAPSVVLPKHPEPCACRRWRESRQGHGDGLLLEARTCRFLVLESRRGLLAPFPERGECMHAPFLHGAHVQDTMPTSTGACARAVDVTKDDGGRGVGLDGRHLEEQLVVVRRVVRTGRE